MAIQDGMGGSEVAPRVKALMDLGFVVAGFLDNDDRNIDAAVGAAEAAGAPMIRWDHGCKTETQICSELSAKGLNSFIKLGVKQRSSEDTVLQDLNTVDPSKPVPSLDVEDWLILNFTLEDARDRIAAGSVNRKWFKEVEGGRVLGRWIVKNYQSAQLSATVAHLEEVRAFVYPDSAEPPVEAGDKQDDA